MRELSNEELDMLGGGYWVFGGEVNDGHGGSYWGWYSTQDGDGFYDANGSYTVVAAGSVVLDYAMTQSYQPVHYTLINKN